MGGYESTSAVTKQTAAAIQLASSTTGSLQTSLETESAERKTQDEKISKSIGSINNTLLGYIGSASTSKVGDGTLRGAIGNTSIAGIGAANNLSSAISALDTKLDTASTDISNLSTSISNVNTALQTVRLNPKDGIHVDKTGKTVVFTTTGVKYSAFTSYTLPDGYRPANSYNIPAVITNSVTYYFGWICVYTNGTMTARFMNGSVFSIPNSDYAIHVNGSWIVD